MRPAAVFGRMDGFRAKRQTNRPASFKLAAGAVAVFQVLKAPDNRVGCLVLLRHPPRFARFSAACSGQSFSSQRPSDDVPFNQYPIPAQYLFDTCLISGSNPEAARFKVRPSSSLADKILDRQKSVTVSTIDSTERACGHRPCRAISSCVQLVTPFSG
jgi:hypothetical protein